MNAVHLIDVTANYGNRRVLGPLSLQMKMGECVALVGSSGCGKSTLLGLIYDEIDTETAYVPQELGLVQSLSVFHNVYMARLGEKATWYNIANLIKPFKVEIDRIVPVLARLSIADKIWTPVGELSGGQKQRTAVARSLYQRAEMLLADEPVSALDGPLAEVVMNNLTDTFSTAIIAMHDVELALRYSNRIIGIRDGSVVLDEPSVKLKPQDLWSLY